MASSIAFMACDDTEGHLDEILDSGAFLDSGIDLTDASFDAPTSGN